MKSKCMTNDRQCRQNRAAVYDYIDSQPNSLISETPCTETMAWPANDFRWVFGMYKQSKNNVPQPVQGAFTPT